MGSEKNTAFAGRTLSRGMDIVSTTDKGIIRHFVTAHPFAEDDSAEMFRRVSEYTRENGIHMLSQIICGGPEICQNGIPGFNSSGNPGWPVTFICGDVANNGRLYGTQAFAVSGCNVIPVYLDGKTAGTCYEDEDAVYCYLGDLYPDDVTLPRAEQASQTFEKICKALAVAGMDFSNVVRTWLYLDKLLDWYDEFNVVRTSFFEKQGVFNRLIPASTGIGAGNTHGAAMVAGAYAIKPKNKETAVYTVHSPGQCEATSYRSSFSRAVEIAMPGSRQLIVSGTASISKTGESIHIGDLEGQIEQTMDVVRKIIESREMDWHHMVRGIAYFSDTRKIHLFQDYCRRKGLPRLPSLMVQNDICRHDLLFEIEADLIKQII